MALSGASFRSYVFLSICLSGAVVGHAAFQKRFFYRTMVYLGESKLAFMAVANLALVSVMLVWKAVQRVFLGPLRFREVERLNTRARDAIIECCFATTIFRDEVNLVFLALVTTLLMLKSLHWLAKDRMDFLEEQPLSPRTAHVRLVGFMALLFVTDSYLVWECAKTTFRTRGGTMLVLFAFEFTVLLIELCSEFVRYIFHAIDLRMEGRWDSKGLYSFYNELVTDMCQLTIYLAFFLYVHTFYTFPLHILREVYITFSKFQRRCSDFLRYRRVVSTMNELFPDATEEELSQGDRTCIICREEMTEAKKLACGHMFHARCLQSWLKRQLSCPTCRTPVDVNPTSRNTPPQEAQPPAGPQNNLNAVPPVGGAVPPPPDDVQQGPGFWDHARRLWRHIAFGAPRDGGPPEPAQQPQAQPNRANVGAGGPGFRLFGRRFLPNVRVGVHMGNRQQEMGNRQQVRFYPLPPGAPLPPGMEFVPAAVRDQLRQQLGMTRPPMPQPVPTPTTNAPQRNTTLRTPQPNAAPIDQLIVISENLVTVRRQVDLLRDQVQGLLVQATEQAQAEAQQSSPNAPTALPNPPAAAASTSVSTAVASRSSQQPSSSSNTMDAVSSVTPEILPENFLAKEESAPPAQTSSSVATDVNTTTPPDSTAETGKTQEECVQQDLRAKRLAFLSTKTRLGESPSSLSTREKEEKDNSS